MPAFFGPSRYFSNKATPSNNSLLVIFMDSVLDDKDDPSTSTGCQRADP